MATEFPLDLRPAFSQRTAAEHRTVNAERLSLLRQHHDRSRFDQVFRADDRDFTSGRKDILGRLETGVHHAGPRFLQTVEDREAERFCVRIDHDVQVGVLL